MAGIVHWLVDHGKDILDAFSATVLVGTLVNILPSIASILTIIWTLIRLWEWFKGKFTEKGTNDT